MLHPVRSHARSLLATALLLASSSCLNHPDSSGGCPRDGVESARRCKRACVLDPATGRSPLPCNCLSECMCWKLPGHSRPVSSEDAGAAFR